MRGYYLPFSYDQINVAEGTYIPSTVKKYNNQAFKFWERAFFQRACSTLKIGMPKVWSEPGMKDLLYYTLFAFGFCGCGELPEIGKWFNPVTISGFDFYYRPRKMILTNPYYNKSVEMEIGKDGELIRMTPDLMGVWDIIAYHAEKMALMDPAVNTAIINSKFAYFVGAKNKAAAEVLKKLFDRINSGEPAVFFDKKLANDGTDKEEPWQSLMRDNLKQSYIVTDLLRDMQTIINDFDAEIGIPTVPYQKKERMVTDEAVSRQMDATSRSVVWYEHLRDSFETVNNFLGFEGDDKLTVELRFKPEEEGGSDGTGEDNPARDVSVS